MNFILSSHSCTVDNWRSIPDLEIDRGSRAVGVNDGEGCRCDIGCRQDLAVEKVGVLDLDDTERDDAVVHKQKDVLGDDQTSAFAL